MREKKILIIASNNSYKISELKSIFKNSPFEVISMAEAGFYQEIEEIGKTFEENAILKARSISSRKDAYVFADDSGLEVEALDLRPGILSARYAGKGASDLDKINKLLCELKDKKNRRAKFVSVIALSKPDRSIQIFRGEIFGRIIDEIKGNNGFGYDPIFVPYGYDKTFAELESNIKNLISHRAKATQKMVEFISLNCF